MVKCLFLRLLISNTVNEFQCIDIRYLWSNRRSRRPKVRSREDGMIRRTTYRLPGHLLFTPNLKHYL